MSEELKAAASPQSNNERYDEEKPHIYCEDPSCKNPKAGKFSFPCHFCREEVMYCVTCIPNDKIRDNISPSATCIGSRKRTLGYYDFPKSMPDTGCKCRYCGFVIGKDIVEGEAGYANERINPFQLFIMMMSGVALSIVLCDIIFDPPHYKLESVVLGNLYERGVLQIIGSGDACSYADAQCILYFTDGYSLKIGKVAYSDRRYFGDLALKYPIEVAFEERFTWWLYSTMYEVTVACNKARDAQCQNASFHVYFSSEPNFRIHPPQGGPRLAYPRPAVCNIPSLAVIDGMFPGNDLVTKIARHMIDIIVATPFFASCISIMIWFLHRFKLLITA